MVGRKPLCVCATLFLAIILMMAALYAGASESAGDFLWRKSELGMELLLTLRTGERACSCGDAFEASGRPGARRSTLKYVPLLAFPP